MAKNEAGCNATTLNTCTAIFFAWAMGSCAFWLLPLAVASLNQSFQLSGATPAAVLGTVTLFSRFLGGVLFGLWSELSPRKIPFLVAVGLCGASAGLSAAAPNYVFLLCTRGLFGVGLGGVWVAGMSLALEALSPETRGRVSAVLQGGWNWGFIIAAALGYFATWIQAGNPSCQFVLGLGGLLLVAVPWIAWTVHEPRTERNRTELRRVFTALVEKHTLWTELHASLVIGLVISLYFAVTYHYPQVLRNIKVEPFLYVVAMNIGAIIGTFTVGSVASGRLGRRATVTIFAILGVAASWWCLMPAGDALRGISAISVGATAIGIFGIVPGYLRDRFPENLKRCGPGITYHLGVLVGAPTPTIIALFTDRGWAMETVMKTAIGLCALSLIGVIWLGPEQYSENTAPTDTADSDRAFSDNR